MPARGRWRRARRAATATRPRSPAARPAGCSSARTSRPTAGTGTRAAVTGLERDLGRGLAIDHRFKHWDDPFPTAADAWDHAHGRIPMITWEPDTTTPRRDRRGRRRRPAPRPGRRRRAGRPAALPALRPRDERRLVPVGRRAHEHARPPRRCRRATSRPGATCTPCSPPPARPTCGGCGRRTTAASRTRRGTTPRATTRVTTSSTGSPSTATTGRRAAPATFASLFGPTVDRRSAGRKPLMIAETATDRRDPARARRASIDDVRRAIDDAVRRASTRWCGSTPTSSGHDWRVGGSGPVAAAFRAPRARSRVVTGSRRRRYLSSKQSRSGAAMTSRKRSNVHGHVAGIPRSSRYQLVAAGHPDRAAAPPRPAPPRAPPSRGVVGATSRARPSRSSAISWRM